MQTMDLLEKTVYKAVGANPAHVANLLQRAQELDEKQIRYEHYQRFGEDVIRLIYDRNIEQRILLAVMQVFSEGLEDCLYANEEVSLPQEIVRLLQQQGKRLSTAESFTGGGISAAITSVSGASSVFFEGLNTYHEEAKIKRLGVRRETLQKYGAVSKETVHEMALGLLSTDDCDLAVSTTGIAGPNSDITGFPVGLCFIGIGDKERVKIYRYRFEGDRETVTQTAIRYALFLTYKHLKNI